MQNAQKGRINIINGHTGCFYYVEISFRPISLKLSMIGYTNILPTPHNMAIAQSLRGHMTYCAKQLKKIQ